MSKITELSGKQKKRYLTYMHTGYTPVTIDGDLLDNPDGLSYC